MEYHDAVPSVLLAPVTLLAGPQASLTVLTTLGFAGSAASLFFVLRRRGAGPSAAALGGAICGAICGFSPALRIAAEDHYPLQFAVLLPLIVDAVLRLATGRGRPIRTGAWLGVRSPLKCSSPRRFWSTQCSRAWAQTDLEAGLCR